MNDSSSGSRIRVADFEPVEFKRGEWKSFDTYSTDFIADTNALPLAATGAYARLRAAFWNCGTGWSLNATEAEVVAHAGARDTVELQDLLSLLEKRGVLLVERAANSITVADPRMHHGLRRKQQQRERKSRGKSQANDDDPVRGKAGVNSRATSRATSVLPSSSDLLPRIPPASDSKTDAAPTEPCLGPSSSAAASDSVPKPRDQSGASRDEQPEPPADLRPHERWWRLDRVSEHQRAGQARFVVGWSDLMAALRRAYPHLDTPALLAAAYAWEEANPGRRKTPRGRAQFIRIWIANEQDRGSGRNQGRFGHQPELSQNSCTGGAANEPFDPRKITLR